MVQLSDTRLRGPILGTIKRQINKMGHPKIAPTLGAKTTTLRGWGTLISVPVVIPIRALQPLATAKRRLTSCQLTTFHQAAR